MWHFCKGHQLKTDCLQSSTLIVALKQLRQQTNEKTIYNPKFQMPNFLMSFYGIAFHAWLCVPLFCLLRVRSISTAASFLPSYCSKTTLYTTWLSSSFQRYASRETVYRIPHRPTCYTKWPPSSAAFSSLVLGNKYLGQKVTDDSCNHQIITREQEAFDCKLAWYKWQYFKIF